MEVTHSGKTDFPYFSNLTQAEEIERLVRWFGGIAVVEITQVKARLDYDESWVLTNVTATPITVLRNDAAFKDNFNFWFEDGVMRLGGVEIRAGTYPLLKVGATYLVFAMKDGEGNLLTYIVDATDTQQMVRPEYFKTDPAAVPNFFKGMSLDDAIREIRKSLPR